METYEEFIEETSSQDLLKVHSAICDQCGKGFSNIYTLTAHKKQVHEGFRAFPCEICETKFATKYKLKRHHLGVHSEKRDFHCETCRNSFKTRDMLVKHQRTHFQGPFTCDVCNIVFKFKSGLDHHQKLKHSLKTVVRTEPKETLNFSYKCSFCSKLYKTLKHLERHEEIHTVNESLECSDASCTTSFKNSKELTKHVNKAHKEVVYYSCFYCSKVYKSKSNFEIHITSHDSDYNIEELTDSDNELKEEATCTDPEEADYELLKNIDENMVSVTKIETERLMEPTTEIENTDEHFFFENEADDGLSFYEAIIAEELESSPINEEETMTYTDDFVIYKNSPSNDTSMISQGKTSKKQSVSSEKVKTQKKVNEKISVCDECGAAFKNNSHLRRHVQRKHRKDSHNLECDVCGSKFLLNYDLKRHMIKHSSIRDFSCTHCEQKFKTELSLRNHIKVLHSSREKIERAFSCKFCYRSYFHQRHLDYHMR